KSRKIFLTACRVVQSLGVTKRRGRIIFVLLAVFFLGPNAPAKTKPGDWRVVENLEPGAHIIVNARHRYSCTVEGATDDQLFCWVQQRRSFHRISIAIPRTETRRDILLNLDRRPCRATPSSSIWERNRAGVVVDNLPAFRELLPNQAEHSTDVSHLALQMPLA